MRRVVIRALIGSGIFTEGLAVGIVLNRILANDLSGDVIARVGELELAMIVVILLLGCGMFIASFRPAVVLGSATGNGSERATITTGNQQTPATRNHSWALTIRNFGAYESIRVSFTGLEKWRSPFTLRWNPAHDRFVALGSVALAALAQYRFTVPNTRGYDGVVIYLVAMFLFTTLVSQLEAGETPRILVRALSSPFDGISSRIRKFLVAFALLAIVLVLFNPDLGRWDHDQTLNIMLWGASILAFTSAFFPWDGVLRLSRDGPRSVLSRISIFSRSHIFELLTVAGILILAFVARAYDLSHIPRAFAGDEGEMAASALDVLRGKLVNPFITGWLTMPTLYSYAQSFSLRLFGTTVFGIRMFSVIEGTLTVLGAWLLVRELFGQRVALVTATLLAVYSAHVHMTRTANPQAGDGLVLVTTYFLLYRGLSTRKTIYFVGAGLAVGLGTYGYQGGRLFAPALLAGLFVFWWLTDRRIVTGNVKNLVAMVVAALLVVSPLLLYYWGNHGAITSRLAEVSIFSNGYLERAAHSPEGAWPFLAEQFRRSFLAFNLVPENTWFYGLNAPMLDNLSGCFLAFGLSYCVLRFRREPYYFVLIWFLLGVVLAGVLVAEPPTSHRLEVIFVPVIVMVAIGIDKLFDLAGRLWSRAVRLRAAGLTSISLVLVLINLNGYFVDYTPKQVYGGLPALAATEMGEFFLEYPRPFKAYVLADSPGFVRIGTLRFMDPQLDSLSIDDELTAPPTNVDTSRDAVFVIFPSRIKDLEFIRTAFPVGTRIEFSKPDGTPLFLIYEVPS